METGTLIVESSNRHPELVRIYTREQPPAVLQQTPESDPRIRYMATFEDVDAAAMHAHEALRRRLVDLDNRLYRVELLTAIAAVEAIGLHHRRVFLDPELDTPAREAIAAKATRRVARRRRLNRIWTGVGWFALGLLLLRALFDLL